MLILAHGCFDCLHIGHVMYLQAAKSLGDRLIVTITADKYIKKGEGRPLFNERERKAMLDALTIVDECTVIHDATALPAIRLYKPSIYAKGPDYGGKSGMIDQERELVEQLGGSLVIIRPSITYSSTDIVTGKLLQQRNAR